MKKRTWLNWLINRGLKKYEINAIEFDWLFNKTDGVDFLFTLSKTKSIEVFSIEIIRLIILYLWSFYRRAIFFYMFIPFMLYFCWFLIYSTWMQSQDEETYSTSKQVLIILIFIEIAYNVVFEIIKLVYFKRKYFTSLWNYINITSLILNMITMICDLAKIKSQSLVPMLSVSVFLMWIKLIYFGRMYFSTAWLVRMVVAIIKDMKYFFLVFAIMVIAFSNSFYIISKNGDPSITGDNFWYSVTYSYR